MVGDTDDDIQTRRRGGSGHRAVPHTADVRVEAWGVSRERCLVEAALGMVECFADVTAVRPTSVERVRLEQDSDEGLLTALLDEVVFRLDVDGRVPVDLEADPTDGDLDVRLALVELTDVEITGASPKGVSWHGLHIGPDPYGWSCAVTVDV
ncbi:MULTISPECIES: archease [unclassified Streptomyces]|uniref:archease n=1 Tax=unclassified Streptomyces TaxID=2593676 RepID=UPI00236662F1|nr:MULTISPECIES: archease [unclassified Streptomyces]MDF3147855.1 archease [Streptomyces sp. T21Q-yed]WDF43433.1 archease [Streptomyces sp. T12]